MEHGCRHVLAWSVFSTDQVIANYLNEPAIVRDANKGHIIRRLALNFNRAVAMCALLSRWARAQTTLPEFVTLNGTVVSSVISHQSSDQSSLFTLHCAVDASHQLINDVRLEDNKSKEYQH
jgi:hypothetical protein